MAAEKQDAKMKAVIIHRFSERLDEVSISEVAAPSAGEQDILIKVVASGVNFVDTLYARGRHQNNRKLVLPPFTLGLEFSGIVVSSPADCAFQPGDAVFGDYQGSYAETIRVPAKAPSLYRVPYGWKTADAAGLAATLPVSYGALVLAGQLKPGETVLVHAAAGGLGIMAVQIAVAMGCKVIGTAGSAEKCQFVRRFGAAECFDYTQDLWWDRVLESTGGNGVNVVFDPVGEVRSSIRCTAQRGRILVIGFAGTEGQIEQVPTNRLLLKQISLIGYRFGESLRRFPEERELVWDGVARLLQDGKIKPTVTRYYNGLQSVPQALYDISNRQILGKAVIMVDDSEEHRRAASKL